MTNPYEVMPGKLPGNLTPEGWSCRREVWELSRRDIGVSIPELGSGTGKLAESAARSMLALGQIFAGRPSCKAGGHGVRYFATQQAATDYFKANPTPERRVSRPGYQDARALIAKMASRPQGVSYSEMQISIHRANKEVEKMVTDGILFRRNPGGTKTGKGMRFFSTKEAADKFFGVARPNPRSDRRVSGTVMRGPAHLPGEPDFSKAKWIIAPPPVWSPRTNTYAQG